MRLWHKDLIPVLPRQQLLAQWRECCCIARNIAENGTPNHLLVNKIMDYPFEHFLRYVGLIKVEFERRGYKVNFSKYYRYFESIIIHCQYNSDSVEYNDIFEGWHTDRYFWQCYYNLQEKFDCGGIPSEEWMDVVEESYRHC